MFSVFFPSLCFKRSDDLHQSHVDRFVLLSLFFLLHMTDILFVHTHTFKRTLTLTPSPPPPPALDSQTGVWLCDMYRNVYRLNSFNSEIEP